MKHRQFHFSLRTQFLALTMVIATSLLPATIFASDKAGKIAIGKTVFEDDKKPVKKRKLSKKTSVNAMTVKIYPDMFKKSMHVVAKSDSEKEMSLYVFDVEGTLVTNYKIKAGDHKTISGLPKGLYVYNVFCDDEQVASGRITFK